MRILEVAPLVGRYPERYVVWLAEALLRAGHDVVVVTSRRWSSTADLPYVKGVDDLRLPLFEAPLLRIPDRLIESADVIHLHVHIFPTTPYYLLTETAGKSLVTFHGLYRSQELYRVLPNKDKLLFLIKKYVYDEVVFGLCRRAGALSSVSKRDIPELESKVGRPVHYTPNLVDVEYVRERAADRRPEHILFVGRPSPRKGFEDLLRIAWSMSEERFVAIGYLNGGRPPKQAPPNLTLEWNVSDQRYFELLSRAKALVVPSYEEALPMAVLEALAVGIPVVSYDVGDIATCSNSLVCPIGDLECMIDMLRSVEGIEGEIRGDCRPENALRKYLGVLEGMMN